MNTDKTGENIEATGNPDDVGVSSSSASRRNIRKLLAGTGRNIDEFGGFDIEITPDRTKEDIFNNRPGEQLREKILNLPELPGVYMYLDRSGKVIYVGKAKRLKRRVSSYFNRYHEVTRTNLLVRNIVDMRFIVVPTEEDALHLENAMIKEYQPRYNVLLKDDKSYPWIVVTKELYPRVFMTREKGIHGRYYGPYANQAAAKVVLQLIREVYPLRSCRHTLEEKGIARNRYSLCLDYHIHKCLGPCRGLVSPEDYGKYITRVRQILNGETVELENVLKDEMSRLSEEWKFEEAQVVIQYFMNFRIGVNNPARTVTQRAPDTGKEREPVEVTHITLLLFCKLETYCTSVNARGCPCLHPVGTKTNRDKLFGKTFGSILRDAATFYLDSAEMHETVQEGTRCQNNLPRLEDNPERGLYSGNLQ